MKRFLALITVMAFCFSTLIIPCGALLAPPRGALDYGEYSENIGKFKEEYNNFVKYTDLKKLGAFRSFFDPDGMKDYGYYYTFYYYGNESLYEFIRLDVIHLNESSFSKRDKNAVVKDGPRCIFPGVNTRKIKSTFVKTDLDNMLEVTEYIEPSEGPEIFVHNDIAYIYEYISDDSDGKSEGAYRLVSISWKLYGIRYELSFGNYRTSKCGLWSLSPRTDRPTLLELFVDVDTTQRAIDYLHGSEYTTFGYCFPELFETGDEGGAVSVIDDGAPLFGGNKLLYVGIGALLVTIGIGGGILIGKKKRKRE